MRDSSIRLALPSDLEPSARLREALWPESSAEEHLRELTLILADQFPRMMPLVIFVCRASDETLVGFIEVGLRSQADGCDESRAVGYVEGWYVADTHRRRGIGSDLLRAAEDWACGQG